MPTTNNHGSVTQSDEKKSADTPASPVRHYRTALLLVFAMAAWAAISWRLSEHVIHERAARLIEREQEITAVSAASFSANTRFSLAHMRSIPKVLAKESGIEAILVRAGPNVQRSNRPLAQFRAQLLEDPALVPVVKRLDAILAQLEIDQIWIINAAGDCIASGGFRPEITATGINYADRAYFQMAKEEGAGRQFAVGRTTNTAGLFYSAAVVVDDVFVGVIAVKMDIWRLSRTLTDRNTFLTDEYGVVVAAGDTEFAMKVVPGNGTANLSIDELQDRYKRHVFGTLVIDPVDIDNFSMTRLSGRESPMLKAVASRPADMLTTWVFRDVPEFWRIRNEAFGLFILFFLIGTAVIASLTGAMIHFQRRKEHQRQIASINAELVKLNDELRIQARFDALTGCINRRYFFEELGTELKRSARFKSPCCLAVLDIDHFKAVNDQHGHAAGDTLLRKFSLTVGQCLRASDLLGRIGGEEFALLMPQTSLVGSIEFAERIRTAIEQTSVAIGHHEARFSVSIGVAQWEGVEESIEAFIARGDKAMYVAKRTGRNRVCAAARHENQDQSTLFPESGLIATTPDTEGSAVPQIISP